MPAIQPLCSAININAHLLSREENLILEAELFVRVCEELNDIFKSFCKEYFRLLKLTAEMEKAMLEADFLRHIITDIVMTNEYTVQGIACYTQSSEDVICDLISGKISEPSLQLSRKVIDLHRSVRPELYRGIVSKIANEYLTVE